MNVAAASTQGLLKFARQKESKIRAVDLTSLLPGAIQMVERRAEVEGVAIIQEIAEDMPPIQADPGHLDQVMINLLNNALDAVTERHGSEGGQITVQSRNWNADQVSIEVTDNGSGISSENLGKVFTPFFSTKPVGKGTGLGLPICYGIVTEMGGKMEISSRPDQGTTIVIRLPRSRTAMSFELLIKGVSPLKYLSARQEIEMTKLKIMLVDDEERFLSTTSKLLSRKGFEVMTATGGNEALDILQTHNIHVIVLDVKMPGLDGVATLKEIKRRFPIVEVIMLTGHATVESAIDGLKSGAFDYLMKPCDIDELISKAEEAFRKRESLEEKIRMARSRSYVKSPREILKQAE